MCILEAERDHYGVVMNEIVLRLTSRVVLAILGSS